MATHPADNPDGYDEWAKQTLDEAEEYYDKQEDVTPETSTTSPDVMNDGWGGDSWGSDGEVGGGDEGSSF